MSRQWGIRMDGAGQQLEQLLRQHVTIHPKPEDRAYTLIEIGSAGCVTLRAFTDILRETLEVQGYRWRTIGFDLPPGKAWSLDMDEVNRAFDGKPLIVDDSEVDILRNVDRSMLLMLLADPRGYLTNRFPYNIDFAFIDASHGKSCAHDFRAIELKVAPGGLVVFHDYGEPEQGTDWQAFDREFISVRSYVHRLGLASPCPAPRKGWRFVGEIKGSRHWGGEGNSCAVVQRTNEPLEFQPELSID